MEQTEDIKRIVKTKYAQIATGAGCCSRACACSGAPKSNEKIAREIGYSEDDLKLGEDSNLGLGCGNPVAMGRIREGDTVLDLGCGAGFDCFLASGKVGATGKVIGVDMTPEMISKAKENAEKLGRKNIEFIQAEIEELPIEDNSIDVIITNCVINLTPDKLRTFREACRVLKPGGRLYLSDIVLLEELSFEQKNDEELLSGCVAGALLKKDYLEKIRLAGLDPKILYENSQISKQQYNGIALESLGVEAIKLR
ncbi:MAG: arsenite methyltransferase [Candidatus Saccharibacteria bacterium]